MASMINDPANNAVILTKNNIGCICSKTHYISDFKTMFIEVTLQGLKEVSSSFTNNRNEVEQSTSTFICLSLKNLMTIAIDFTVPLSVVSSMIKETCL